MMTNRDMVRMYVQSLESEAKDLIWAYTHISRWSFAMMCIFGGNTFIERIAETLDKLQEYRKLVEQEVMASNSTKIGG